MPYLAGYYQNSLTYNELTVINLIIPVSYDTRSTIRVLFDEVGIQKTFITKPEISVGPNSSGLKHLI